MINVSKNQYIYEASMIKLYLKMLKQHCTNKDFINFNGIYIKNNVYKTLTFLYSIENFKKTKFTCSLLKSVIFLHLVFNLGLNA